MPRFLMTSVSPNVGSVHAASCRWSRRVVPIVVLSVLTLVLLAQTPVQVTAQAAEDSPAAAASETAPAEPAAEPTDAKAAAESKPAADAPDATDMTAAESATEKAGEEAKAEEPSQPAADTPESESPTPKADAESGQEEAASPDVTGESSAQAVEGSGPLVEQLGETTVTQVEDEADANVTNWTPLILFVAVVFGAFFLAWAIASSLRVREYQTKLTIIFLALFAAGAIVWTGWPPKLGIDLKGGVYLVYETGEKAKASLADAAGQEPTDGGSGALSKDEMDKLVAAISRRINPGGVKEVVIRPFGQNQIEIVIPEVDESEIDRYKQKITSAGTLEFRILANRNDHRALIEDAQKSDAQFVYMVDAEGNPIRGEDGAPRLLGWWVPVSQDADKENSILSYPEIAKRSRKVGERTIDEVLVVKDPYDVTGGYLVRAAPSVDQSGRPNVTFMFNTAGGSLFAGLTGDNLPDTTHEFYRKLGIVLDGYLFSAPRIQSQIRQHGEISGDFTEQEVQDLVDVLNAGMLPTTLKEEPISQMATGPSLGKDTIRQGRIAIGISLVLVLLFMAVYYRFAGMVACLAMLANLLLILGVMIFVKAAFTLPGIAGLVLTVGMAVDANVLIFERIREELDRQATLRMAIRNGFSRATTTIVDANLTTLITGVVLYTVGTDQIKGFAVTLILGVVLSMFTAIYCARVVFDIAEKKRWLTKMSMARIPLGGSVDFIGLRRVALAGSGLVILIGLVAVLARGKGLLDIDFTGGVSVHTVFKNEQKIGDIRKALLEHKDVFQDLAVSETGPPDQPGRQFMINTGRQAGDTDADVFLAEVEAKLQEVFGDKLVHHSMTLTPKTGSLPAGEKPAAADESTTGSLRSDLPGDDLLAAADETPLVPAQASAEGGAETPAPSAEADKAEAAEPEAKQDAPPVGEGESAPAATGSAESEQVKPGNVELVTWNVEFGEDKITYATLAQWIRKETTAYFELHNAEYNKDLDQDRGHTNWDVSIALPADQGLAVLEKVQATVEATPMFPSSNTIGGKVAGDTQLRAVAALLASLVFIVAYIWVRFQRVMFGLAAVVALVHDVLVALGAIALTYWLAPYLGFLYIDEFKIGLPVLAAFLTIIGYSLNDTIVVFDRIREVRGKAPNLTAEMINKSINQTLSRTLLTSFTTLIVVVILYAFGGDAIRVFAFSLVVGVIVGTYSSIFVASPVLLWIAQSSQAKSQKA